MTEQLPRYARPGDTAEEKDQLREIIRTFKRIDEEDGLPVSSTGEMAERVGVSQRVARQRLRRLQGRGYVKGRQVDGDNGTILWVLKEDPTDD